MPSSSCRPAAICVTLRFSLRLLLSQPYDSLLHSSRGPLGGDEGGGGGGRCAADCSPARCSGSAAIRTIGALHKGEANRSIYYHSFAYRSLFFFASVPFRVYRQSLSSSASPLLLCEHVFLPMAL